MRLIQRESGEYEAARGFGLIVSRDDRRSPL